MNYGLLDGWDARCDGVLMNPQLRSDTGRFLDSDEQSKSEFQPILSMRTRPCIDTKPRSSLQVEASTYLIDTGIGLGWVGLGWLGR